ncbi:MAG: hypothetical protein M1284_01725 [Candidatus Parvarchaeota archaeon]|jgi:hypothetical protein|nr:hypothetical protein [Candidatus Parvarchaeota archaeon]MCL5420453.1 hypothetical protein [Candidatus Parvarchaeota archaeon]
MAKVTVTICDICKQKIATKTCPVCGKDLCEADTKSFAVDVGLRFGQRMQIYNGYMCEDDYRKLEGNLGGTLAKISDSIKSQIDNIVKESVGA